jgi:hypothetical protein
LKQLPLTALTSGFLRFGPVTPVGLTWVSSNGLLPTAEAGNTSGGDADREMRAIGRNERAAEIRVCVHVG